MYSGCIHFLDTIRRVINTRILCIVTGLTLINVLISVMAHAYELHDIPFEDKFRLRVGYFKLSSIDSSIRADSSSGSLGAELDFENDLAVDTSTGVLRLDADYRFNKRHSININYYSIERNGSVTLDREISFRDETFNVDRRVISDVKNRVIELDYDYTLFSDNRMEFNVGTGLRSDGFDVKLQSLVNPADSSDENDSERTKSRLYLPVLVLSNRFNFTPKLSMTSKIKQFLVEVDDEKASLADFELFFDYQLTQQYDLGFSIGKVDMDLETLDDDLQNRYDSTTLSFFSYMTVKYR